MLAKVLPRVLAYGFAFFLLFLEWLFRTLSNIDSEEFMGPTLAAAGLGVLVPLVTTRNRLEKFPQATQDQLKGYRVTLEKENSLVEIIKIVLFAMIALWAYDLYLASKKAHGPFEISPLWMGMVGYLIAIILAEVKETT